MNHDASGMAAFGPFASLAIWEAVSPTSSVWRLRKFGAGRPCSDEPQVGTHAPIRQGKSNAGRDGPRVV